LGFLFLRGRKGRVRRGVERKDGREEREGRGRDERERKLSIP